MKLGNVIMWLVISFALMQMFNSFKDERKNISTLTYTQFLAEVRAGNVKRVVITGKADSKTLIAAETHDGKSFTTYSPGDPRLLDELIQVNVDVRAKPDEEYSLFMQIFVSWFPMLLLIGVWIFFMKRMQGGSGGGGGVFGFGKSKARMDPNPPRETFADVAGCDEAKYEVAEIVEFLRHPEKFQRLGGKMPRGVLMVGNPGTGKTLMAKAIAGEAKVPFFLASGSEFVEMFVGVGASRVRDMFDNAKKMAPCIIFIDEIDAVGGKRGHGVGGGGHDEREQTLNQLLVEMDGFGTSEIPVIVIAATNRPDTLDPALVRPGRFDRQVVLPLPDIRGREQILMVHMRRVPIAPDVEAGIIARGTPGFSGADLANLVNEAALFASRKDKQHVEMEDFEKAQDKILMGAERSMVMSEEERRNTAYHESGHAVVAKLVPKSDPVHKVTIIPRGRSLGSTWQLPEQDRYSHDKQFILCKIAIMMGGRIAEEVFMHQMTTGASNDFEVATGLARDMVTRYGMSELGTMVYGEGEHALFGSARTFSEDSLMKVDVEIKRILDEQYALARKLIEEHRDEIETMTKALLEWETIDADQIADIMAGREPKPPKPVVTATPQKNEPHWSTVPLTTGINPESKEDLAKDIGYSDKK